MRVRMRGVGQPGVWKQPPHFRAPMEEPFKKRIGCVFGSKRVLALPQDGGSPAAPDPGDHWFLRRFQQYLTSRMGSAELHACPICYSWLEADLLAERGATSDADPISVLVSAPQGVDAASHFVFPKKKDVVAHLRVAAPPPPPPPTHHRHHHSNHPPFSAPSQHPHLKCGVTVVRGAVY